MLLVIDKFKIIYYLRQTKFNCISMVLWFIFSCEICKSLINVDGAVGD